MTKYIIEFSSGSITDIEEAVNYYNSQSRGLGNRFLSDFESVYKAIALNPFFASVKYDNIHCAAFIQFPLSIHYVGK